MNGRMTIQNTSRIMTWALGVFTVLSSLGASAWARPPAPPPIQVSTYRPAHVRHVRIRPRRRRRVVVKRRAPRTTIRTSTPAPKTPKRRNGVQFLLGGELGTAHHDATRVPNLVTGLRLAAVAPGGTHSWVGMYGRLQFQPEADLTRKAIGLTAGYRMIHGELGIMDESELGGSSSLIGGDRSGTELLVGVGIFDYLGLYSRVTAFDGGGGATEYGIRMNFPLGG